MVSEKIEDYLEAILLRSKKGSAGALEVREVLGVSGSSVTEMFKRLEDKGLVDYTRYHGAELTDEGERIAKNVFKKHSFLVKFLESVGVPSERAEVEACGIEHVVSGSTVECLENFFDEHLEGEK